MIDVWQEDGRPGSSVTHKAEQIDGLPTGADCAAIASKGCGGGSQTISRRNIIAAVALGLACALAVLVLIWRASGMLADCPTPVDIAGWRLAGCAK